MKVRFDGQQQYQVNAVLDVFDGQPIALGQSEIGPIARAGELPNEPSLAVRLGPLWRC